jgi:hypothetical protein
MARSSHDHPLFYKVLSGGPYHLNVMLLPFASLA